MKYFISVGVTLLELEHPVTGIKNTETVMSMDIESSVRIFLLVNPAQILGNCAGYCLYC